MTVLDEQVAETSFFGLSGRDDCYNWCQETKSAYGSGSCCANMQWGSIDYMETEQWCVLYNSPEGETMYTEEEIYEDEVFFYSSRPVEEPKKEMGMMEQAQGWFEDTFNMDSSIQVKTAMASIIGISIFAL